MAEGKERSDTEKTVQLREALESRATDFYAALQGVDPKLCPDVLAQYFLENDIDDVVGWAYDLDITSAKAVVRSLFDIIKDHEQPVRARLRAMSAVRALPPHERNPNPADIWPEETLHYALDTLSELILTESGDLLENGVDTLPHVLYHWYHSRQGRG